MVQRLQGNNNYSFQYKKKTDTMGKKEKEKTSCQKKKKDWTKMGTIKSYLILVNHDIKLQL
ncbi:hypothetical protein V1478_011457 [Vespula squamosa]|uniref:Uncharacterized protein n=1 Tax=Vespula squamosa TaxID=30214 RepID=A0ABD2AEK2_VESSQ